MSTSWRKRMFQAFLTIFVLVAFVGLPLFIWKIIRAQANAIVKVGFDGTRLMAMKSGDVVRWTYDVGDSIADVQTHIISTDVDRTSSRSMVAKPGEGVRSAFSFRLAHDEIIAAVTFARPKPDGKLIAFDPDGAKLWEMTYAELFGKAGAHFGLDWTLRASDQFIVGPDKRSALVFQHSTEWPWLVVLLDADVRGGRVTGRFLNAGKIDKFQPFATDKQAFLVLMGTSESRNASMMALVDALSGGGVSPEDAGSKYACASCADGAPFRYIVFPRTEVNVVTRSRVNRVSRVGQGYAETGGRTATPVQEFSVTTEEMWRNEVPIDDDDVSSSTYASYDFDYGFEKLLRSSVDDAYWKIHKYFERKGALTHAQAACRERNGPPLVRMWDAAHGWRDLPASHL